MIFVRRDPKLIPEKVLRVAERAQAELEALPAEQRAAFVEKKKHISPCVSSLPVQDVLRQVLVLRE